ncbi:MAG: hypothetical protein ACJ788_12075 [Ktedonobacteraceae bacterium]
MQERPTDRTPNIVKQLEAQLQQQVQRLEQAAKEHLELTRVLHQMSAVSDDYLAGVEGFVKSVSEMARKVGLPTEEAVRQTEKPEA